ncbi:hypothetical protein DFH06DRAFT_344290 [Mycena polygramma]|nr:hypothetical protein DFH06DRAFT_344290 [Mycena polygramma]
MVASMSNGMPYVDASNQSNRGPLNGSGGLPLRGANKTALFAFSKRLGSGLPDCTADLFNTDQRLRAGRPCSSRTPFGLHLRNSVADPASCTQHFGFLCLCPWMDGSGSFESAGSAAAGLFRRRAQTFMVKRAPANSWSRAPRGHPVVCRLVERCQDSACLDHADWIPPTDSECYRVPHSSI